MTSTIASGLVLAAGIGAMHFVGMRSLRGAGDDPLRSGAWSRFRPLHGRLVHRHRDGAAGRPIRRWAAIFLTLAVAFTHFIAMGSVTLDPVGGAGATPLAIPRAELAMATVGACFLILTLALAASILDQHFTRRLAQEARRFRTLADATFEGLIFERDGQIVDANRAMCELAGTDAASLIGRPLSDLIPDMELPQTQRGRPVEHAVRLADGQTMPVEILWRSGPDRGERVVAVRDISREKPPKGGSSGWRGSIRLPASRTADCSTSSCIAPSPCPIGR